MYRRGECFIKALGIYVLTLRNNGKYFLRNILPV